MGVAIGLVVIADRREQKVGVGERGIVGRGVTQGELHRNRAGANREGHVARGRLGGTGVDEALLRRHAKVLDVVDAHVGDDRQVCGHHSDRTRVRGLGGNAEPDGVLLHVAP